ncbi:MAG: ABC transporter permease [Scytonema sp. PMC 1069.18]|nr:ABC transporter permease [Scytonema sp. PMC 1069.18]MEC4884136.1 ABC transporter permease [Scytonema sp. PMC 1070.18]
MNSYRLQPLFPFLSPLIAILSALIVGAILILIAGANPINAYTVLFQESLSTYFGFGNTLTKMTPLLFTSLGILIAGGMVGLLHAFLSVTLCVDQLVSGLAINLVAAGFTSFFSRLVFSNAGQERLPEIAPIIVPVVSHIPLIGRLLFQQDLIVYFLFLLIPITTYILYQTSFGLTLRAVGEYPQAADTSGISVSKVRYLAVIVSGCLASLGGAYLTVVQVRYFTEGMTVGKGFIAIAALIFGKWHPIGSSLACLLFGATEALQLRIQALGANIPYQFLVMLPYAIALFALVGLALKSTPPAALGIPYVKASRNAK